MHKNYKGDENILNNCITINTKCNNLNENLKVLTD